MRAILLISLFITSLPIVSMHQKIKELKQGIVKLEKSFSPFKSFLERYQNKKEKKDWFIKLSTDVYPSLPVTEHEAFANKVLSIPEKIHNIKDKVKEIESSSKHNNEDDDEIIPTIPCIIL